MSERTVYRHFPDRAALVQGLTARLAHSEATRAHTRFFGELVGTMLPGLDDEQHRALSAVVRVLASAQTWLRLREEFGLDGDASGPIVAWAIDALVHEVERGNPPPTPS